MFFSFIKIWHLYLNKNNTYKMEYDRLLNSLTYCLSCEKNCVIALDGFTQYLSCKEILIVDLKQVRRNYCSKVKTNKINNFTKTLNEYLYGSNFYEVQQIVDIFSEFIDFMIQTKKVGDKLPNINAEFFIKKILFYLSLSPAASSRVAKGDIETKRKKGNDNNEILWYNFTQYRSNIMGACDKERS